MAPQLSRVLAATLAVLMLSGCARDPGFVDLDQIDPPKAGEGYTPPPPPTPIAPDPEVTASRVAFLAAYCTGVGQLREGLRHGEQVPAAERAALALDAPAPAGLDTDLQTLRSAHVRFEDTVAQDGGPQAIEQLSAELDEHLEALVRPMRPLWLDAEPCRQLSEGDLVEQASQLDRLLTSEASFGQARVDDPGWLAGAATDLADEIGDGYQAAAVDRRVELVDTATGLAVCLTPQHRATGTVAVGRCDR